MKPFLTALSHCGFFPGLLRLSPLLVPLVGCMCIDISGDLSDPFPWTVSTARPRTVFHTCISVALTLYLAQSRHSILKREVLGEQVPQTWGIGNLAHFLLGPFIIVSIFLQLFQNFQFSDSLSSTTTQITVQQ